MSALWCLFAGHRWGVFRYGIVTAYTCKRCGVRR